MSPPEPPDTDAESTQEPLPSPPSTATPPSVLETLRSQYAAADAERRKTMMILPGRFNASLAGRFHPIPFDETRRKARKMAKSGETSESELNFVASIIAEACEEILIRPKPGAELVSLGKEMGLPVPVRFDDNLRSAVGMDVGENVSEPGTVRLLFKNPEAMTAFYAELATWLREESAEDEDDAERPT